VTPVSTAPAKNSRPLTLNLDAMASAVIPPGTKGVPPAAAGKLRRDLASNGYNLLAGDIPLPACVLSREALSHNRATMREFTERMGVHLAPHGKSSMAPQLFAEQCEDGAWAMTAGTPAHLFAYRSVKVSRILYANQLIDPVAIAFVLEELEKDSTFEFICLLDSIAAADILVDAMRGRRLTRPLDVLIEIGVPGARTGVRDKRQALLLARHLTSLTQWLRLRGLEAFEGVVPAGADGGIGAVTELLDTVADIAFTLSAELLFTSPPIISVGGSAFFGTVAAHLRALPLAAQIILRSGCYLTNDHGMYACAQRSEMQAGRLSLKAPMMPAIEVWAHVQSRPEPTLVIASLGKRDISYDIDMPIPVKWSRRGTREIQHVGADVRVESLNDQHARLRVPEGLTIQVGDRVAFGCSHPCTTFDKWKYMLMVDSAYTVIDVIATLF
jgi:D-serine dehydratase